MSDEQSTTDLFIHQKDRRSRRDPGTDWVPPRTERPVAGTRTGTADGWESTEDRIRRVVADRTFEVQFQPIVDLESGHHQGAEALSRALDG